MKTLPRGAAVSSYGWTPRPPSLRAVREPHRVGCETCGAIRALSWKAAPPEDERALQAFGPWRWFCSGPASGGTRTCTNHAKKADAEPVEAWVHPCRPLDAPHKPVRPRLPQPDMCLLPDFGESINEALVTLPDFSPASLVPMTVQATPLAPSTVLQSVSDSVDSIVVSVSMDSVRRPQVIRFAFCVRVCLGKTCCEKIRACGHTPARLDISQKQFIYAPRSGELWCFVSGDLFLWRRR